MTKQKKTHGSGHSPDYKEMCTTCLSIERSASLSRIHAEGRDETLQEVLDAIETEKKYFVHGEGPFLKLDDTIKFIKAKMK